MGRGVSSGGGQSSLGYLFGSGEPPKAAAANKDEAPRNTVPLESKTVSQKPTATAPPPAPVDVTKQAPAGIPGSKANYSRSEGQNSGNFLTDRPSTKVAAAPGGGSSLDYLFGGGSK